MKIVVFGLSVTSAWGNGHATLWRGMLRALAARGHEVVFFERDTEFYAAHRDLPRGDGYEIVVYPSWADVAARAASELESADVAMVTSYQPDAEAATEALLTACPGVRVFYDLDTPVTLALLDDGRDVPWLPHGGLGDFDLVLSYTGGSSLEALARRLGAQRVEPLYGFVDLSAHHPAARRDEWASALSYLGTYAPDRQDGVERLFLEVAARMPTHRFLLGGPMYPDDMRRPPNVTWLSHVPPADHPAFYGSSTCTLNLTRGPMRRTGYCPSARLFEAAACGVPVVSDLWEGLDTFFEPGREILVARSTDEVVAALTLPAEALSEIAKRAQARARAEHTSDHRAEQLLELVRATPLRRAASAADQPGDHHEEALDDPSRRGTPLRPLAWPRGRRDDGDRGGDARSSRPR